MGSDGRAKACSLYLAGVVTSAGHCRALEVGGGNRSVWRGGPEKGAEWDPISRDERIECSPFPAWYYNHQHRTLQSQHRAAESAHMAPTCRSGGGGASENMLPSPGWRGHQRRALQAQHRAADQVRRPIWHQCAEVGRVSNFWSVDEVKVMRWG